jgi:hypothetical protein
MDAVAGVFGPCHADADWPAAQLLTRLGATEERLRAEIFVEPFNAEVRALAPEERIAAVAASLESVRS